MCDLDLGSEIIDDTRPTSPATGRVTNSRKSCRVESNDTLARLGGDEFGLLPHDCGMDDAVVVANGPLKAVEHHAFVLGIAHCRWGRVLDSCRAPRLCS